MPAPGVDIDWIAGLFPVLPGPGGRVTLLFTDIAGFTRHAAALGDREAVRLVRRHDAAVLPAVRIHAGRIVKRLGDGVMVAFPSPAAALAAAVTMQRAAARRPPLRLRIGIHAGVARVSAGDLIGHHVNVASRIGDRARAGEIPRERRHPARRRHAAGRIPAAPAAAHRRRRGRGVPRRLVTTHRGLLTSPG